MADGPAPTPPDHAWRCCSCTWSGDSLTEAKAHLLATAGGVFPHHPFEAPRAKLVEDKPMSAVAVRIMLPSENEGKVLVSSYAGARRRLYKLLDGLVLDLRARGGRLRGG